MLPLVYAAATLVALGGCKDPAKDRPGSLVISTQTDMSVPGGIDTIELRVEIAGEVRHEETFEVAPVGKQKIPFVYTLDASDEPAGEVTISVVGLLNDEPQVFAQTVTTFPEDERTAIIELPLQWLCTGQVEQNKDGTFESSCDPIKDQPATCVAGECRLAVVKESALPDYAPRDVFGGASKPGSDGVCFPTESCFDAPIVVVVPNADCQVEVEGSEQQINLALQLPQSAVSSLEDAGSSSSGPGICNPSGCFVPLDNDPQTGYTFLATLETGDAGPSTLHVALPKAVCEKLDAGELTAVVASSACATKTSRTPTCGEWSSTERVIEVVLHPNLPGDAAADATPEVTTTLPDAGTTKEITIVAQGGRDSGTFVVGDTIQLTLEGTESDDVEWKSDNEDVATVTDDGFVSVVGVGIAIITATVDGQTVEFRIDSTEGPVIVVTVIDQVTFLMLDPSEAMIPAGASLDIAARGTLQDGSTVAITELANWSSSDESIATVEDGHVVGLQPGDVTIRAEANDIIAESTIHVSDATLELLTADPSELTLPTGLSHALVATATYSNGQSLPVSNTATWTSGNDDIVQVDATGLITAVAVGETLVTAEFEGKTDTVFIQVTDAALEALDVVPDALSLYVGQRSTIVASALYSDGQTVDVSGQVAWQSSNEESATVAYDSQFGLRVTGVDEGDATITGTFGDKAVEVAVTVTAVPLSGLMLAPSTVSLPLGATTALALVANYADGQSFDATDDADWSTANPNVATILADGTVVAQGLGTVEITAHLGDLEASSSVTVTDARLLGVSLNPSQVTLIAGQSRELEATASYSDGHPVILTTQADWSSSDTSVVVDDQGAVHGNTAGSSTITVSFGGFSDTALVTVVDAEPESLRVVSDETTVPAGTPLTLRAEATYTDGTTVDVSSIVTWRSDNSDVGVVSASGVFTGKTPGDVNVSATMGQETASLELQVTNALPLNIVLSPNPLSLARGTTQRLTAEVEYSDGTSRAPGAGAQWSSLNQTVATVNNGTVTGVGEGLTEIVLAFAGLEGRATASVTMATPTQLTVTPNLTTVADGQQVTFTALVTYSDGSSVDATSGVTWRSVTPELATVNATTGVALATAPGTATIEGTFGDLVDTATFAIMEAAVAALEVTPASASVAEGNTSQFAARATYTDGTSLTVTDLARWSSGNTSVATVADTALARGVSPGSTTITATFGGRSASATLRVTDAALTGLTVLPNEASVAAGNTQRFVAEAEYSDGTSVAVSPAWSTSSSDIATINNQGEARGRQRGQANVIASFGGLQAQAVLNVTNAVVVGLLIAPSNPTIPAGTTRQFTATATYSDGSTGAINATFTSSNTERLQINSATGLAIGAATGNATVTASAQGLSSSTTAQVTAGTLDSISVAPSSSSVPAGNTVALEATATYTDGRTIPITASAAWRTSNADFATVQAGLVTTRAAGSVTITAEFNGETAQATVTVTSAVVTRVAVELVDGNATSAPLGQSIALRARATYSDGTSALVTPAWSVSSTSTPLPFTVNVSGAARAAALGQATITATFSGVAGSLQLTATNAVVVGLAIDPAQANVIVGTNRQLVANATYSDGSTSNVSPSATWTTGDGYIARVTAGLVTGVGPGPIVIRATFNGATATANIVVVAAMVTAVTVTSPEGTSVPAGLTRDLVATATYDNGTTEEVTFEATWSSSSVVLEVNSGVATGRAVGDANVSATFENVSGSLAMSVTDAQLTGLRMDPTSLSLPSGRNGNVRLLGTYTDGSEQNLTTAATWTSENGDVAAYGAGQVQAGDPGSTTITATTGGLTATLPVSVTDAVVESISVIPDEGNVPAGNTVQLRAEANYSDGHSEDVTSQANWTSGSPSVAAVNGGLVTGVAAGSSALISAAFGGQTGSATIAVTNAVVTRVVVDPASASIPNGTTRQLAARAIYSNGTESVVTNTAMWERISGSSASVNASGLVTGVAIGSSVIRATFSGVAGTSTMSVTDAVPNGLTLTPAESSLIVGTTPRLTANESYTDGRVVEANTRATWTSSAGTRASVNNQGVVTGSVAGDPITITASVDGFSATASIVVIDASITSITVNVAESTSVPVGLTRQLSATATYNNGTSRDVTAEASWGSSSATILRVSPPAASPFAIAEGRAVGNANATATIDQVVGSAAMQVTSAVVTGVRMAPTQLALIEAQRGNVQLFAQMSGGTQQNVTTTSTTTWESENASIASVGSGGVVSANDNGRVRIYGNYGGFRASSDVTVTAATISSLRITLGSTSIPAGTTTSVKVEALWNNETVTDATTSAEWTTSNPNGATVANGSAVVQAGRQTGTVDLTASVSGVSAIVRLTVTQATLTSLDVTPASTSLVQGSTTQLQATATFSDGSSSAVTTATDTSWMTSNGQVASMLTLKGQFRANSPGQATITASYRGVSDTAVITVTAPQFESLEVEPYQFTVAAGAEQQLIAWGYLVTGERMDVTSLVNWSSGDPLVLSINDDGLATGLSPGVSELTVTYGDLETNAFGVVPDERPQYSELRMCPSSMSIPVGAVSGLAVMGLSEGGYLEDISNIVTWTSGDENLQVDTMGTIVAVKPFEIADVKAEYIDNSASSTVTSYDSGGIFLEASPPVVRVTTGGSAELRINLVRSGTRADVTTARGLDWGVENGRQASVQLDVEQGALLVFGNWPPGCTFVRVTYQQMQVDVPITVSGPIDG